MNYLSRAILSLRPGAEFSFFDEDYATIKWDALDGNAPTKAQVESAITKIKAEEALAEQNKATAKAALLDRLGITAEEAALLVQ